MLFLALLSPLCALLSAREYSVPADTSLPAEPLKMRLALTFDDGPKASTTSVLLDGLAQRGVKATFFLIGQQLPGNEDLVRRMASDGHQIGLHSLTHVKLQGLSPADLREELDRERTALENLLGPCEFWLRPPYGLWDEGLRRFVQTPIVLWSVDPEDWNHPDPQRVAAHILSHVQDGDIILLHDIYPESVEAALTVVDTLLEQGCVFLTVDELLLDSGVTPQPGQVYRHAPR